MDCLRLLAVKMATSARLEECKALHELLEQKGLISPEHTPGWVLGKILPAAIDRYVAHPGTSDNAKVRVRAAAAVMKDSTSKREARLAAGAQQLGLTSRQYREHQPACL